MFTLPPMLPWNAMHVAIVHFPIALLMVAIVPALLAVVWRRWAGPLSTFTLALLLVGTASAMLATATGEAAQREVPSSIPAAADEVLEDHEHLGERTRNLFVVVTGLYAAAAGVRWWRGERGPKWLFPAAGALLILPHAAGLLMLANTAHQGGRLVHEFGIRAPISGPTGQPGGTPTRSDDHD